MILLKIILNYFSDTRTGNYCSFLKILFLDNCIITKNRENIVKNINKYFILGSKMLQEVTLVLV